MEVVMGTQRLMRPPFALLKGFPTSGWFVKRAVYLGAVQTERESGGVEEK